MKTQTLLLAGIAASAKWGIWPEDVAQVLEIPPGRHDWDMPLGIYDGIPATEEIQLEHYTHQNGEGLWMGYGPRSKVLLFSHELPLDAPPEEA